MLKSKNYLVIFIMAFTFLGGNAVSYNCNESVDRIVTLLNSLTLQINEAGNLKEIESVSFTPEMTQTLNTIYQNCKDYKLTSLDKKRLNKAYEDLITAYIEKFYKFSPQLGVVSKSELFNIVRPMLIDPIKKYTLECVTLGSWIEYFSSFFKAISSSFPSTGNSGDISNKKGEKIAKLKVSNVQDYPDPLVTQGNNTYYAKNMFDGSPHTCWSVHTNDLVCDAEHSWGPTFDINAKKIESVKILNGYAKSITSYKNNTRASWIVIYRADADIEENEWGEYVPDSEIIYEGNLKDVMEFQTLPIDHRFDNSKPTKSVGIIFGCSPNNFYRGAKYDDLSISEIEFYGVPLSKSNK